MLLKIFYPKLTKCFQNLRNLTKEWGKKTHDISPNLMLKCELCDYICSKNDEMKKHKIDGHEEVCHERCTICGKKFLKNHELEIHLKIQKDLKAPSVENNLC
jgi:hypothetical protein